MRLNNPARPPAALTADAAGLSRLIEEMCAAGASDLHIKVPSRPLVRVDGALIPMPHDRLMPEATFGFAKGVMDLAKEFESFATVRDARVAFAVEGLGRFRAQVARQRGSYEVVIHRVASDAPTLADFPGLESMNGVLDGSPGLTIVGGGRQRRAALSAIVREFNEHHWGRLVSLEDPVDWLHRDARASISQREVGTDVATFHEGVVAAMRQDPDALAVTDMPTVEDVDSVLRAAEEGLHVFAGLPVCTAGDAVATFVGRFSGGREREIGARLAGVLRGVAVVERDGRVSWHMVGNAQREALRAGQIRLAV